MGEFLYKVAGYIVINSETSKKSSVEDRTIAASLQRGTSAVFIMYVVKNIGMETRNVTLDGTKIRDKKGRKFDETNKFAGYISKAGMNIGLRQMQPGIPEAVMAAFIVPTEILPDFDYILPKHEVLSREYTVVGLGDKNNIMNMESP